MQGMCARKVKGTVPGGGQNAPGEGTAESTPPASAARRRRTALAISSDRTGFICEEKLRALRRRFAAWESP